MNICLADVCQHWHSFLIDEFISVDTWPHFLFSDHLFTCLFLVPHRQGLTLTLDLTALALMLTRTLGESNKYTSLSARRLIGHL